MAITIGKTSIGGSSVGIGEERVLVSKFQAGSSFIVREMYVYFNTTFSSGEHVKLCIYDDNAGEPDNLLGTTSEIEGNGVAEWKSSFLASSVSITSGNYYWLGFHIDDPLDGVYDLGGINRNLLRSYASGLPDPFGSGATSGTASFSIYAKSIMDGSLSKGGAVLEASDGTKIAVHLDASDNLVVWKDIDGTPSLVDSDTAATIHGAGAIGWIDAAIDSNDDIHVISSCTTEQTRDVAYCVCDLTTGFGTWEQAGNYTETAPANPGCAISIDSNDYPHILFVDAVKMTGATADNVYYDYNDGTWSGAEQVGLRTIKTWAYNSPKLTLAAADDVEAFYYRNDSGDPAYRRRNGTWSGESYYTETDAVIGEVLVTTGDTAYRYHTDTDEDIEENDVDTTYNADTTSNRISASLVDDSDRYIFYIDTSDDVHVISNDGGGWTDESAQQTGTYLRVVSEWAYNNENQSGEINYIFDDGTIVYYDAFSLAAGTDHTKTLTEAVGVTDSISFVLGHGYVITDSVGITDAITNVRTLVKTLTEAVGITDAVTNVRELFKTLTESVGITDAIVGSAGRFVTLTESVGITDTIASVVGKVVTIAESVGITDAMTNARALAKTITESVGITDVLTNVRTLFKTITENVGVTDTITNARELFKTIIEAVGITDTINAALKVLVTITDGVGITDAMTNARALAKTIADNVGITDIISNVRELFITLTESVGITDALTNSIAHIISFAESVGITDVIDAVKSAAAKYVTIADGVGITDTVSNVRQLLKTITDNVGITDAIANARQLFKTITESVGITDAIVASAGRVVAIIESVGITDVVSNSVGRIVAIAETVGITDAVSNARKLYKTLTESVGITDVITTARQIFITIADALGITDSLSGIIPVAITGIVNVKLHERYFTSGNLYARSFADLNLIERQFAESTINKRP